METLSRLITGTTYESKRKQCHKWGNTLVWQGRGIQLFASGAWHGIKILHSGININIGPQDGLAGADYFTSPNNFLNLPSQPSTIKEVLLNWSDYDIPNMGAGFWKTLANRLSDKKLPVLCFCQGGHGRTGTCLAILLGIYRVKRPVEYVRRHYCSLAIESEGQVGYVDNILTQLGLPHAVRAQDYVDTKTGKWYDGYNSYYVEDIDDGDIPRTANSPMPQYLPAAPTAEEVKQWAKGTSTAYHTTG